MFLHSTGFPYEEDRDYDYETDNKEIENDADINSIKDFPTPTFTTESSNMIVNEGDTACFCGQNKEFVRATRATGGEFAEVNEFPWAALLNLSSTESNKTVRCGGTLIKDRLGYSQKVPDGIYIVPDDRYILTSAHCLQQDSLSGDIEFLFDDITVILGNTKKHS